MTLSRTSTPFLLVLLTFLVSMIWAAQASPFLEACSNIWAEPWGRIMLADLYIGFALFALWIGWRERSTLRGAVWFVVLCVLGNLAALGYLIWIGRGHTSFDFLARIPNGG